MISLKNTNCGGTSGRNGTCYTEEECATRGGINSGTCAGGYGICCVGKLVKHLQLQDYLLEWLLKSRIMNSIKTHGIQFILSFGNQCTFCHNDS